MSNIPRFKTRLGLSAETWSLVATVLNQHLADLSDLVSQFKNAHWNVRGPHFYSLHKVFEDVAGSIEGELDSLAERITTFGGIARGSVRQAAATTRLPELLDATDGLALVAQLADRTARAANAVRADIDRLAAAGDAGTADLLTGLCQTLDKGTWLLEAHLEERA